MVDLKDQVPRLCPFFFFLLLISSFFFFFLQFCCIFSFLFFRFSINASCNIFQSGCDISQGRHFSGISRRKARFGEGPTRRGFLVKIPKLIDGQRGKSFSDCLFARISTCWVFLATCRKQSLRSLDRCVWLHNTQDF